MCGQLSSGRATEDNYNLSLSHHSLRHHLLVKLRASASLTGPYVPATCLSVPSWGYRSHCSAFAGCWGTSRRVKGQADSPAPDPSPDCVW